MRAPACVSVRPSVCRVVPCAVRDKPSCRCDWPAEGFGGEARTQEAAEGRRQQQGNGQRAARKGKGETGRRARRTSDGHARGGRREAEAAWAWADQRASRNKSASKQTRKNKQAETNGIKRHCAGMGPSLPSTALARGDSSPQRADLQAGDLCESMGMRPECTSAELELPHVMTNSLTAFS